ncbi:hypothetical protein WPS_15690 [Vulcanimicrobium alpinum]|uniref:Uncharacterized protein n=1 Tax=Vulcanimicrobium alpinum TaxID=3016050 RepID=A0AAN1XXQ8_UNVUL|nr:hypothetical protein WPS_15690 [Vulcanimicrobium alpinum]
MSVDETHGIRGATIEGRVCAASRATFVELSRERTALCAFRFLYIGTPERKSYLLPAAVKFNTSTRSEN